MRNCKTLDLKLASKNPEERERRRWRRSEHASMANRRCFQTLTRCVQSIRTLTPLSESVAPFSTRALNKALAATAPNYVSGNKFSFYPRAAVATRNFSSRPTGSDDDDEDEDEEDDEDEDYDEEDFESEEDDEYGNEGKGKNAVVLSAEDKLKEAAEIGYTVVGPLQESDKVFKKYEPVFAVVQVRISNCFRVCISQLMNWSL